MQTLLTRLGLRRLLLLLTLGWLLATALAWVVSSRYAQERLYDRVQQSLEETQQRADLASANLNQRLTEARSIALSLSIDPAVVEVLSQMGPDVRRSPLPQPQRGAVWAADPQLSALSTRFGLVVERFGINTLWLTNAAGDTLAEGHAPDVNPFVGTNYADREYFKEAQQGLIGHQFAIGRITNVYGLYFSAPVQSQGQFIGIVGVGLSIPKLATSMLNLNTLVTDDLGVIVQAQDASLLMHTMPGAAVTELSVEQRDLRYKRIEFAPAPIEPLQLPELPALYSYAPSRQPWVMQSRATDDGSLVVYAAQDLSRMVDEVTRDQLWWFGLASLLGLTSAALAAGLAQFVISQYKHGRQLEELNAELARQASTDALTGCANRRSFMKQLSLERERAERFRIEFCLVSWDVDFFKRVNDTYGHAAGDTVLMHLVAIVRAHLRDIDTLGRIGGEEFCILLPQTTASGGMALAERIRLAVEQAPALVGTHSIPVTISLGGAQWLADTRLSADALLQRADEAMYRAKQAGRNCVKWLD